MHIKIGTRGSKLALAQTGYVKERLESAFPENTYEIVVIRTTGDKDLTKPLDQIGSKGMFVDEIENALLGDDIQLAVHSMKDMPSNPAKGLIFAKAWKREDPRDVLLLKDGTDISDLPIGANVATGSKRRSFQLLRLRPDLNIVPIRGNIDTRIRKLGEGLDDGTRLDGIVLAAAGLNRLDIRFENRYYFDADEMIPAPAQGTLAIELNEKNTELKEMVDSLGDDFADKIAYLERGFLKKIGGDCHLPIGAYAYREKDKFVLKAMFGNEDGSRLVFASEENVKACEELVDRVVADIVEMLEKN